MTIKNYNNLIIFNIMKNPFQAGDKKEYSKIIQANEIASFESGTVHEVYSTFAIARDAEWSGRLFVLEMKEETEEGIGTKITVEHKGPAFIGQEVRYVSTFVEITGHGEIITSYEAYCDNRIIATGMQGQKILPKKKIDALFRSLESKSAG